MIILVVVPGIHQMVPVQAIVYILYIKMAIFVVIKVCFLTQVESNITLICYFLLK